MFINEIQSLNARIQNGSFAVFALSKLFLFPSLTIPIVEKTISRPAELGTIASNLKHISEAGLL